MAARFWIGGGTTTGWNASPTTNWCATSGGTTRVAAPTSSDDVTFDGAGGGNSASVVSAAGACLSLTFTAGYTNTITINTGQTLTISGNFTDNTAHTWVVSGTGAMAINAASTITSGGKTFPGPVTFSNANTKTLSGDWTITGTLTISATTTITSNTLTVGGLTMSAVASGTTAISMSGGTWSGVGALQNNLTIAGNVTVSGSVAYNTGTLTYSSGTVTTTGSTLTISAAAGSTLNTNGITWNNLILGTASTITNNSLLSVTGTLTISASVAITFAGTSGFTVSILSCPHTLATTITLVNNVTYTITTAFNAFNSRTGAILLFTSDHASNKAILTLNNGATCNVLASFTRIDASAGRAIWTFNGVITTCFNIFSLTDLSFVVGKSQVIQGMSSY